jgi:hypothetical protein
MSTPICGFRYVISIDDRLQPRSSFPWFGREIGDPNPLPSLCRGAAGMH